MVSAGNAARVEVENNSLSGDKARESSELKTLMTVEKQTGNNVTKEALESVATSKPSSGAENIATYPKLKDDLVQQNLSNIASQDARLAAVVKGDN